MSAPILLSLRDIKKSFGAVQVLLGVDLDIKAGSVTALVGDNGAGKSTLIKCIAGIYQADSGQMSWEGQPVKVANPKAASAVGIEFVYQDLALCDNLDVVQNMFLGRERKCGFLLDHNAMEAAARDVLAGLSVTTVKSVRQPVASLSGGQRQSIAVAKAVMWNSKLVVLDEPTAALGVAQTKQVLALVRRLAERGLGVLLVSHNLEDVLSVSDSIAVLRLGRLVTQVQRDEVDSQQLVELITTGRLRGELASDALRQAGAAAQSSTPGIET
ncbi:sugar ABC transporter ATP-binding protein [Mesorhizobium sp. Root695]|uniref:ATP-binding cassette domain-containing protein n=1 Tax=Mesorhizobium sp. Root695 TaxID=1736589 RepID=UPI00070FC7A5|nr:ATP-binding cassette domain-containing protein [Mesorhizobium sp. Root695]KRB30926.1 sugar ABC transporter ATP-binding protein [Mesorhizobium sp. Root695]